MKWVIWFQPESSQSQCMRDFLYPRMVLRSSIMIPVWASKDHNLAEVPLPLHEKVNNSLKDHSPMIAEWQAGWIPEPWLVDSAKTIVTLLEDKVMSYKNIICSLGDGPDIRGAPRTGKFRKNSHLSRAAWQPWLNIWGLALATAHSLRNPSTVGLNWSQQA